MYPSGAYKSPNINFVEVSWKLDRREDHAGTLMERKEDFGACMSSTTEEIYVGKSFIKALTIGRVSVETC